MSPLSELAVGLFSCYNIAMAKYNWLKLLNSLFTPFLIVAIFVALFVICQHDFWLPVQAAQGPDAVGIKVLPNPEHLAPLSWYNKNIEKKGAPQSTVVDGYQAIRDGRSVYINAANLDYQTNPSTLYTNIYIISYNQGATSETVDIFGQLLKNWKFNVALVDNGGEGWCLPQTDKLCTKDEDCQDQYKGFNCEDRGNSGQKACTKSCLLDADCPDNTNCFSDKSKLVRDVRRLSDLIALNATLQNYANKNNSKYISLPSGSYLPDTTISVWPSWQDTFGKGLGTELPLDPVNKLGLCPNFDAITCWNELKKTFATDLGKTGGEVLPDNSHAYVYLYDSAKNLYKLCTNFETNYAGLPAKHRCDAWSGQTPVNQPQLIVGNCVRPEGTFDKCYIAAYSPNQIDWSKTKITPVNPNTWAGWSALGWQWASGSGNQLDWKNTNLPSHKELLASRVDLPANRNFGIFVYNVIVYDLQNNSNSLEGVIRICSPQTCASLGAECGQIDDNCGGTLMCGSCSGGKQCTNNKCV